MSLDLEASLPRARSQLGDSRSESKTTRPAVRLVKLFSDCSRSGGAPKPATSGVVGWLVRKSSRKASIGPARPRPQAGPNAVDEAFSGHMYRRFEAFSAT